MSTGLTIDTSAAEAMLHTRVINAVLLPNGANTTENKVNKPMVSSLKGVGLNMVALPQEMLYLLEDGATVELRAWERLSLQVMSEKCINIE